MCLSTVFSIKDGEEELVCEHVTAISQDGGVIKLTDIMNREITITGYLKNIDLVKNTVKIEV